MHKDVKHQKLFSTADSTWRRKNLDALVATEIEEAEQAGADVNSRLRHAAWWKDTIGNQRCLWTRAPTGDRRYYLSPPELEFAMRRLLRLPLRNLTAGALCGCGTAIDPFGDHADSCSLLQGPRNKRHDTTNSKAVYGVARAANLAPEIEPPKLNEDDNGRPADTLVPHGLEEVFGHRQVCYDVVGVGSSVEQYLVAACNNVGGAMEFGVNRKLRSTRRLDDDKIVVPLPFTSQGSLHVNFSITYEQWAAHWATRGEGRSKDAQKALVQTWLAQASATVQKAQWLLTVQLVNRLCAVNARSGQLMKGLLPVNLHDVEAAKVLKVPS